MPLISSHDGGGGFVPARNAGQVSLTASGVSVAATGAATVPFAFGQGDAALVSLATPALPKPVAAGTYAYMLIVTQAGGGAGNPFHVGLEVDDDFYALSVFGDALGLAFALPQSTVSLAATWFGGAASGFQVTINNQGTVGTDDFGAFMYVQRVT